jgi:acyl dehydratase
LTKRIVYLEDVVVGDRYSSREYPIEAVRMKDFAAEFDPQPFHLDEVAAARSFFGGLAASGWYTAVVTMRLIVESVPIAGGLIGAGVEISWQRPVRSGDTLHVESVIASVTPSTSKPDRGIVIMQSDTFDQRGEQVQSLTSRLLLFRRPCGEPSS